MKIPLVITIIAAGAAAFLGFQAKQNATDAKQQIAKIVPGANPDQNFQSVIAAISANDKSQKQKIATTENTLKDTQNKLDLTQQKLDADDALITPLKSQVAQDKDQIKQLNDQATTDKQTITDLKTKVQESSGAMDSIATLTQQNNDLQARLKDSQSKVLELKQVETSLNTRLKSTETQVKTYQTAEDHRQRHIMALGLEGTVLAYNPNWNFIIISIGDHQGVVANAEMVVKRGDEMIAKVRVSNVNPSTATADIIPGTVARGVRVQPGDRVIYTGF